jgi:hypothetical protein
MTNPLDALIAAAEQNADYNRRQMLEPAVVIALCRVAKAARNRHSDPMVDDTYAAIDAALRDLDAALGASHED